MGVSLDGGSAEEGGRFNDKKLLMNVRGWISAGRHRRLRQVGVALLAVAALLVAGCGGGDGGDGDASATAAGQEAGALTKAELLAAGDAICAKVYAVTERLNAEGSTAEAVRFADLHIRMVEDLLDLGTPRETEYSYAEYTTAAKAFAQAETEVKTMARRGDPSDLRTAESSSLSAFSMFQGNAGQYGFKVCAR